MAAKFFRYPFAVSGDRLGIPDPTTGDGYVSYQQGFGPDYEKNLISDPAAKPIPRDQFNELMFETTLAIQQYQTNGFPDFITTSDNGGSPYPYPKFAIVRFDDGSGIQLFMSLITNNTDAPSNITTWSVVTPDGIPPGGGLDFYGTTAPVGRWLVRNGATLNPTTYPRLFAAIGTAWGGDGITTFLLPNSARRGAVGSGGTGTGILGNTVGSTGGSETHSLNSAENGPHSHDILSDSDGPNEVIQHGANGGDSYAHGSSNWFDHHNISIASSGSGSPHNIMQPSEVCLKLIKY